MQSITGVISTVTNKINGAEGAVLKTMTAEHGKISASEPFPIR